MLCDKMSSARMKTSREEAASEQINEWPYAKSMDEQGIKDELRDEVGKMPCCQLLRSYKTRTQRVEKNLEGSRVVSGQ